MADKNKYHKEFGLFSNLRYELKAMSKHSKLLLWLLALGFVLVSVQRYLWAFYSKFVIDIITAHGEVKQLLIVVGIFTLIMLLLFLAQTWYRNKKWPRAIFVRMQLIMKKNLHIMTMPFEFTEDPDMMDCSQKASNAVSNNHEGIEGMIHKIFDFVEQLGVVVTGFFILGSMNIYIVLGMTILAGLNFIISNKANKYGKEKIWDPLALWWRKRWYMNYALSDFSFAKDVRLFGLKDWLVNKFKELNKERYEAQKKNNQLWFWVSIFSAVMWFVLLCGVYAYLIQQVYTRAITIGNFTLYLSSSATFFETISGLLNTLSQMLQTSRQVDDFRSFTENELVTKNAHAGSEIVPQYDKYEFTFENVSFKYPRSENYALKDLNITVKAGERLAVVGLNGAGKSTFIKLLLRLYEPTEGKIYLNGVDISTYDIESYFSIFAPVFQDVYLFAFTLAENVSMSAIEEIQNEKVEKCLSDAGLDYNSSKFPNKLDTQLLKVIYDDGIDLSGGEKQKLALARALYKNAPVVVLDEPTAALDALAEGKLYQDFDKLIGGKTSIFISHRLSSTQFCNNVAMFKDGKMIEYGTHDSLMQLNGEYANMFKVQAQYYLENENNENVSNVENTVNTEGGFGNEE